MKGKLTAALGLAIALALAWWLWRGRQSHSSGLFDLLPARQAVHGWIAPGRIHTVPALARLLGERLAARSPFGILSQALDAVVFSLDERTVYAVATRGLPEQAIRAYLAGQGADCDQPLDQAACSFQTEYGSGYLSLRVLPGGEIALASAPVPQAVERLQTLSSDDSAAALNALADRAAADGALAWLAIDPALLSEVMRSPPDGWVNLSLVSRALTGAERAYFTLTPDDAQGLILKLEAPCPDEAAAGELNSVLGGLNRFGAAAAKSQGAPDWADILDSFTSDVQGERFSASWRVSKERLDRLAAD